jgi:hypothetical protein
MNFCLGKVVESRTHQVMGQTYQFKDSFQWCGLHYEISVRIKKKKKLLRQIGSLLDKSLACFLWDLI